jgi:hypothetical protein
MSTTNSWSLATGTSSIAWTGVASSSDGTKVWACYNGGVYYSSNSGVTWTQNGAISSRNYVSIACSSNGTIVCAYYGSDGYYSLNSGATWTIVFGNNIPTRVYMTLDGSYIIHIGTSSAPATTPSPAYIRTLPPTYQVAVTDTNRYLTNGTSIAGNSSGSVVIISATGLSSGGVSVGTISRTIPASPVFSFTLKSIGTNGLPSSNTYSAVGCDTSGSILIACDPSNGIYYSSNAGSTWATSSGAPVLGSSGTWTYATCFNSTGVQSTTSFAITSSTGSVYISTDGGQTWSSASFTPGSFNLTGIASSTTVTTSGKNTIATLYVIANNNGIYLDTNTYTPPIIPPICFKEGSKILCFIDEQEIYVPIETIKPGTLVKTRLDGYKPVALIGTSKIYNPDDNLRGSNRLYKLTQDAYPEITEDLILTGCHCILTETITDEERAGIIDVMKNVYVTDRKYRLPACVDERATPYEVEGVFSIWHLALEHEDEYMNYGIYANGLLVETTSKRMISQYSGMKLIEQ